MELDFGTLFEIIMSAIVPVGVWIFGQWHVKWKAVSKRLDDLEKDLILVKSNMVTKDRLDAVLNQRLKDIQDNLDEIRKEVKVDVSGLRNDIQQIIQILLSNKEK